MSLCPRCGVRPSRRVIAKCGHPTLCRECKLGRAGQTPEQQAQWRAARCANLAKGRARQEEAKRQREIREAAWIEARFQAALAVIRRRAS